MAGYFVAIFSLAAVPVYGRLQAASPVLSAGSSSSSTWKSHTPHDMSIWSGTTISSSSSSRVSMPDTQHTEPDITTPSSSSSQGALQFLLQRQLQYAEADLEPVAVQQQNRASEADAASQLQQREGEAKTVQWQFQSSELLSNEQMEGSVAYMGDRYRLRR